MRNSAALATIVVGFATATVLASEAAPARAVLTQRPGPLCMAQQACPPETVGVLQIADYGDAAAPIYGFSFGATNTGSAAPGGGGGAGKVSFSDLSVTKLPDTLSAQLLLDTATGRHLKLVEITLKRGSAVDATYRLTDVIVTAFQTSPAIEQISFSFAKIEVTVGGRVACFDVLTNASCS